MKEAVIIGYSGHGYMICDTLGVNGRVIRGYCDKERKTLDPFGLCYLGNEDRDNVLELLLNYSAYLGIGDNKVRSEVYRHLASHHIDLPTLLHPAAMISESSVIGAGSVIMPSVVVNTLAHIGRGVICNTASVIEHECRIADFAHIAPGAVLTGNVEVGENSFVGAGAVIKPGIRVGSNVIIGAGSIVIKNVPDNQVIAGNPAKNIYRHE